MDIYLFQQFLIVYKAMNPSQDLFDVLPFIVRMIREYILMNWKKKGSHTFSISDSRAAVIEYLVDVVTSWSAHCEGGGQIEEYTAAGSR